VSSQARLDQLAARHGLGETLSGRVLLVDDEPDNLVVLRGFLEDEWEIVEARSGAEALQLLAHADFDLVLTDHRMPGLTGVELLESLRTTHPDTAGILITAFSDTPLLISAINRAAVFRHLKKPWEPDELLAAVAQARAHVRALRSNRRLLELLSQRTDALSAALAALEATQQQVLHMERLSTVGRLTAGITHDLRNVVQAMMLLEQQCDLQDTVPAPPEASGCTWACRACATCSRACRAINQFASGGSVALQIERHRRRGPCSTTPSSSPEHGPARFASTRCAWPSRHRLPPVRGRPAEAHSGAGQPPAQRAAGEAIAGERRCAAWRPTPRRVASCWPWRTPGRGWRRRLPRGCFSPS
jgi:CheY-like chemotaxis protein